MPIPSEVNLARHRAPRESLMKHQIKMAALLVLVGAMPSAVAQQLPTAPVTDAMLQDPDPADWLMWRRTLNHWGHSPLDQIDGDNVAELELVWSRPLHSGIQEGTPLVYAGALYFPNPSDVVQAMDAATGRLVLGICSCPANGYQPVFSSDGDKQKPGHSRQSHHRYQHGRLHIRA